MNQKDLPIGIFDSGVGGLTVMRAVADLLPGENLTYLGDTARVPYGNRSAETVRRYALNATAMLVEQGIKALVVACNTASAFALDTLVETFDVPIVGVVGPVSERAATTTKTEAIGVIGTRGTVRSQCYPRSIATHSGATVLQQACPLFVPLAEEGWLDGDIVEAVAGRYLETFRGTRVDTLILGCTHYPLLTKTIAEVVADILEPPVTLLDSATATAARLRAVLDERQLRANHQQLTFRFCTTDEPELFGETAARFFGEQLPSVEHVDIVDVQHELTGVCGEKVESSSETDLQSA